MNLEEYLKENAEITAAYKHARWKYSSIEEFVLKYGKLYKNKPLPKDFKQGLRFSPKACYQNAKKLSNKRRELTYTEGFAVGNMGIPIRHAWCVDKDGNAYDCTWVYQEQREYFGISFKIEYVNEHYKKTKEHAVLESSFFDDPNEFLVT